MITGSVNIPNFEFEIEIDITGIPSVKFINQSSGSQLGCVVAFTVNGPSGPIHIGDIDVPDVTDAWTDYTIPENLPIPFEFGIYQIIGELLTNDNITKIYTREIDICRPGGNKVGDTTTYGVGELAYIVKCQDGKIFVKDSTAYSYKGVQGSLVNRTITIEYPKDITGVSPPSQMVTGFPAADFGIPFNGENFQLFLASVFTYDLPQNIVLNVAYKAQKIFPVTCNIDLCSIKCAVEKFAKDVTCNPTTAGFTKLTQINTQLDLLILSQMQPDCGSPKDYVKEIQRLGNFDCNCYMTGSTSGIGTVPSQSCDLTIACLDTLLELLDPKCITDRNTWNLADAKGKLQLWINKMCACCNGGGASNCPTPKFIAFNSDDKVLSWEVVTGASGYLITYQTVSPLGPEIPYTATDPFPLFSAETLGLDMSSVTFLPDVVYRFNIITVCRDGSQSPVGTVDSTTNASCTTPTIISGTIT